MTDSTRLLSIVALSLFLPLAYAHDPKEHAKEAAAKNAGPDCAAMKDMDHSEMDPNDPVMKAMMAKCPSAPGHTGMDHGAIGRPHGTSAEPHDHGSH